MGGRSPGIMKWSVFSLQTVLGGGEAVFVRPKRSNEYETKRKYRLNHKKEYVEYYRKYYLSHKEENRIYREKNRSLINNKVTKYHKKIRLDVLKTLGGKCVCCGCSDVRALEINHINGGGRKEQKQRTQHIVKEIFFGRRNTNDLNLICRPCNHIYYMNMKGITGWKITWVGPESASV